ncbi:hypothetical protein [Reyranella sp.]|uniref:hypothetical protein n=1 Tax=Reyranella sp. TaxID=1929291 RepID=UPI00271BB04C|nr:hypothetical protein [Reyranella sp.]MDO8976113.1 hypothetical protein [Reyranella sp.]
MALSRQTRIYIALGVAQVAALALLAWFAERQVALGPTDRLGWRPFSWPLSTERAPAGRAYSGEDHDVYVWLTLNALGSSGDCPEGIKGDAALERAVDIRLLDPRFTPVGPGERRRVTDLVGWTRVYVHRRNNKSLRYGEAVAVPYKCDVITAIIDGDARDPAKRKIAHEFLESNTVQVWINKQLEGR